MLSAQEKHSTYSSIREEYVEYVFLAALCANAWDNGRFVEVARSNTDAFGYDIILTCEGVVRHVQLKATMSGGKASFQKVNNALSNAPSGCVVWLFVNPDSLGIEKIGWFGATPKQKLPDLGSDIARHTKGDKDGAKAERPNIYKVTRPKFDWLTGVEELFGKLFDIKD